jgi:26S proteasome regulatory subunit N3
MYLIDQKQYDAAKALSTATVARMDSFNRRSLDILAARIFYYYSWSHECSNCLDSIRSKLLALLRTATLRHDNLGQEVLLNLLLRNYLHYNLYDLAEKLRSKTEMPESRSNQQYCRYLYYLGRIRAIQLEYTGAKECLLQASRKAPQVCAITILVWSIIFKLWKNGLLSTSVTPRAIIFNQSSPGETVQLAPNEVTDIPRSNEVSF